jgi:hypothetical protein
MTRLMQNPHLYDERALLLLVTDLEDRIERLEGARARLGSQQTDPRLRETLRRLRRERASCLSRLLS